MSGIFGNLRTIVFNWFISKASRIYDFSKNRAQSWTIFRGKQLIFPRSSWAKYYSQDDVIVILVWHSFSGFQKGLTLRSSSNGSQVISILVKVARLDSIDKYIDKPTHRWRHLLLIKTFSLPHFFNPIYFKIIKTFKNQSQKYSTNFAGKIFENVLLSKGMC